MSDNKEKIEVIFSHLQEWIFQMEKSIEVLDRKLLSFATISLALSGWIATYLNGAYVLFGLPFVFAFLFFVIGLLPKLQKIYPSVKFMTWGLNSKYDPKGDGNTRELNLAEYYECLLGSNKFIHDENGYIINSPEIKENTDPFMQKIKAKNAMLMLV